MMNSDSSCKFDPGVMVPIIDTMRCEAAGPCVPICPYDVLIIRTVSPEEKAKFPLTGRLKLLIHGGKQAFVLDSDACRGVWPLCEGVPREGDQTAKAIALMTRNRSQVTQKLGFSQ
jgi:4Fe-4S ferredoxin